VGAGKEISIRDLALLLKKIVEYKGEIVFDLEKPDGTPRKLLSTDKLSSMGWRPTIGLEEGLTRTYQEFTDTVLTKQR
jgi:GDP-L-fucose synthase